MSGGSRSPFGSVLRTYRQERGLSQSALADRIVERGLRDATLASLGVVSDKTIANLERKRPGPAEFVRPRPQTVKILASALDLKTGSDEERAFFAAAEETRSRPPVRKKRRPASRRPLFVRAGREEQLARLNDAWNKAQNGEPQFVLLAGDAGAGKTHTVRELCMEIAQQSGLVRVAWGECSRGALAAEPYLPMLQAMNMLLGLVTRVDDPAVPSAPALERQVPAIGNLLSVASTLIGSLVDEQALTIQVEHLSNEHPELAKKLERALGIRFSTESVSGRLDQLTRFLSACASASPVILVLEDLHWANEPAIAMLLHLHRQLQDRHNVSLLVIGTYRPVDLVSPLNGPRHPLLPAINELGRLSDDVIIDLGESIGSTRGRAFIQELTHELHLGKEKEELLAQFLFERTEGHPLFAVELIRWLHDTGKLGKGENDWQLDLPALKDGAPARIQAIIAERLERLPPDLREVVEGAAIQGPTVAIDLIPNTSTLAGDQVAEAVEERIAPRFRLLFPADPITIAGRRMHRYQFQHVLFQQYVYETLTPSRRERLQARTAEKMIALFGDKPHAGSGDIAFYFAQAHRLDEAATHAHHAGWHALRHLNYGVAGYWFSKAEEYSLAVNDTRRALAAQNGRITALRGIGQTREGIELARSAIAEQQSHGFRDLEAEAADLIGRLYYDRDEIHDAITSLEMAISIHRELGHTAKASGSESMLSHAYYRRGEYDKALEHARIAGEDAHAAGKTAIEAEALLAGGNCEADLGLYELAINTYARARVLYTQSREVRGEFLSDLNTGLCLVQNGQEDEAIQLLTCVRSRPEILRAPWLRAVSAYYLGLAYEAHGDPEAATTVLLESNDIRKRRDQSGTVYDATAALLRIAVASHDVDAIRHHLDTMLEWKHSFNGEGIEDSIGAWLSLADAYAELGSPSDEIAALRSGYALLTSRASRIADPDARQSYLTNVPANRDLLARYDRVTSHTAND